MHWREKSLTLVDEFEELCWQKVTGSHNFGPTEFEKGRVQLHIGVVHIL